MRLPAIEGMIERRILLSYRVDPDLATRLLPPLFAPRIVNGYAVAGVCLIRLKQVRPRGWPISCGLSSDNAAHRFAVSWNDPSRDEGPHCGVYIPRRDSSSRFNVLVGGRGFPGKHHLARFRVHDTGSRLRIKIMTNDGQHDVAIDACIADSWQSTLFANLDDASDFYRQGSEGYSPARNRGYEGLALHCDRWSALPLSVTEVRASYFDDRQRFPTGSITFDSALLMRNVPHRWDRLRAIPPQCHAIG